MPEDKDQNNVIPPPPHPLEMLSDEQMRQLYHLAELDPEVTRRLARALDRLQTARPYQSFPSATSATGPNDEMSEPIPNPKLSEQERAAHEAFVMRELSSLLMLAGQLNNVYEVQSQAHPDSRYKAVLKADLLRQAQSHLNKKAMS